MQNVSNLIYVWTALTILSFSMLLHALLPHSMTGKETDTTSESALMSCSRSMAYNGQERKKWWTDSSPWPQIHCDESQTPIRYR